MLEQLSRGVALGLSVVLIVAAWSKAVDAAASREALLRFFPRLRRRPSRLIRRVITAVVLLEGVVACVLLVAPTSPLAAVVYGLAALSFLTINVRAFRRQLACGCFGGRGRAQTRRVTVVRAVLMCGTWPIIAAGAVIDGRFVSAQITATSAVTAGLVAGAVAINELTARRPIVPPPLQRARCGRRTRVPVLERLGLELRQSLAPDAIRHADLAWWAADVSRIAPQRSGPSVFVVAVPGGGGRLNAVVHEPGPSNLVLLTPGGPIAGMSAQIDNSLDRSNGAHLTSS